MFTEKRPQISRCIFVVNLSQAQTECFWLTQIKNDASWVMSGGDLKAVVLPVTVRKPNMEATSRKCSMKQKVITDSNVTYPD